MFRRGHTLPGNHTPNFQTIAGLPFDVECDTVSLYLRAYDVIKLTAILKDHGVNATVPHPYNRAQGAARKFVWWRDRDAAITRGLLALCMATRSLDPSTLQEGDGSRFEPFDELNCEFNTNRVHAWLPRVVKERLTECGRNFRDRNCYGDPGRLDKLNRSAAVRRLLAAYKPDPRPVNFRGVELTEAPVPASYWLSHPIELHRALADGWESHARHTGTHLDQLAARGARERAEHAEFFGGHSLPVTVARVARPADPALFGTPDALVDPPGAVAVVELAKAPSEPLTAQRLRDVSRCPSSLKSTVSLTTRTVGNGRKRVRAAGITQEFQQENLEWREQKN